MFMFPPINLYSYLFHASSVLYKVPRSFKHFFKIWWIGNKFTWFKTQNSLKGYTQWKVSLSPLSLPVGASATQLPALETTTVTDGLAQCQTT